MTPSLNILGALALTATLAACTTSSAPSPEVTSAPRRDLSETEKANLGHQIAIKLKDPESAQFQWPKVVVTQRDGITDYCGFVNSKNSYGGYTGFARFYAQLGKSPDGTYTVAVLRTIAEPLDDVSQYATNGLCSRFGYGADTVR